MTARRSCPKRPEKHLERVEKSLRQNDLYDTYMYIYKNIENSICFLSYYEREASAAGVGFSRRNNQK